MHARSTAPILLFALVSSTPAYALQRAFVSSTGNDANVGAGCTLSAPCRGFQAAHTAVDPGGEIVALDTAGYGAVTISKSVTIMGNPGVIPSIAVSSGAGVTIATADVNVVLRGLNINNVGSGTYGIHMTDGFTLSVENCVVSRFGVGTFISVPFSLVRVVNSLMRGNLNGGMVVEGGARVDVMGSQFVGSYAGRGFYVLGPARASISDSVASDNTIGFQAGNTTMATVRMSCTRCTASNNADSGFVGSSLAGAVTVVVVSYSKATFNGSFGLTNQPNGGTSTVYSQGNNTFAANTGGDTSGTITALAGQ